MDCGRLILSVLFVSGTLFMGGCSHRIQTTRTRDVHKQRLQTGIQDQFYMERDGDTVRFHSRFLTKFQNLPRSLPEEIVSYNRQAGDWFVIQIKKGDTIHNEIDNHAFGHYIIQEIRNDGVVMGYESGFNAMSFGDGITIDTGTFFIPWRPLPKGGYAQADREYLDTRLDRLVALSREPTKNEDRIRTLSVRIDQYCDTRDLFDILAGKLNDSRRVVLPLGLDWSVGEYCFREMQSVLYGRLKSRRSGPSDYSKLPTVFQSKDAFLKWWPANKDKYKTLAELANMP
jgi:hypothetical protein